MADKSPKTQIFEQFAVVAKALGHGNRLELLEHLAQGERAVENLAALAGLSIANASQHLQRLRRAGLVDLRKSGTQVYYRLADDEILALVGVLRRVAERNLAEVDRLVSGYYDSHDDLEPISRQELLRRMRDQSVTVLDVRPTAEYMAGHILGALNITSEELAEHLDQYLVALSESEEVVAYCRGAYCVFSFEAVFLLRRHGLTVRRLEDGFPEWKAADLPVTTEDRDDKFDVPAKESLQA
jgi:DNA-binding transcriptional ArsR family regulator/rhodanese-related sulfurtransferase